MTTVHAMTNDQNLLDLAHRDPRRARAAPLNIVPASTGAAKAIGLVMPKMAGKLAGMSMRVPVGDGSITDFTALVSGKVEVDDLNAAFREASEFGPLSLYLDYTSDPIVSSDIIGNPASCTFDSGLTVAVPAGASTLVKVAGWYDNEWGYANRLVDLVVLLGEKFGPRGRRLLVRERSRPEAPETWAPRRHSAPRGSAPARRSTSPAQGRLQRASRTARRRGPADGGRRLPDQGGDADDLLALGPRCPRDCVHASREAERHGRSRLLGGASPCHPLPTRT